MKISEEKLMAFVDGELHDEDREEVERALAGDPQLREMLDEQKRLRKMLTGFYGPTAQEEVPDKLLKVLGASKAEGIVSLAAVREKRQSPHRWQRYGAIAASLAVGILAGQLLFTNREGPLGMKSGGLVAQNDLAAALEAQLASRQDRNATTRIGLTFGDRQGRACRTFDATALSGVACRTDGDWQVLLTTTGGAQNGEYRQAGSQTVIEAAQDMMAAPPLDAEGERKAMEADWNISAAAD